MKHTPFRILRHAGAMAGKELRSYALLSVTIVLSFSLLLGYLLWTDSSLYNTYKELFSRDRNIVTVDDSKLKSAGFTQALKEKAADYGDTTCLQFETAYFTSIRSMHYALAPENGKILNAIPVRAISVPPQAWSLYSGAWTKLDVTWLDGREHTNYHLSSGEILLDDRLYALFGLSEKDNVFSLGLTHYWSTSENPAPFTGTFRVVGLISSGEPLRFSERDDSNLVSLEYDFVPTIAFSREDLNKTDHPMYDWGTTLVFYNDAPENIEALIRSTGISANINAVYADQNQALERIRTEVDMKAVITASLLLILGINLYSSFCNALNDRRFEIGVKRALGASKWSIIRQFLYESLLVMLLNILISIWLVTTVVLIYKVIYEHTPDKFGLYYTFTLTLSPHSTGMFAACSLALTVVFSLVFAYRATQVQIVDYLKAEYGGTCYESVIKIREGPVLAADPGTAGGAPGADL